MVDASAGSVKVATGEALEMIKFVDTGTDVCPEESCAIIVKE